jgi:hypothetical protein
VYGAELGLCQGAVLVGVGIEEHGRGRVGELGARHEAVAVFVHGVEFGGLQGLHLVVARAALTGVCARPHLHGHEFLTGQRVVAIGVHGVEHHVAPFQQFGTRDGTIAIGIDHAELGTHPAHHAAAHHAAARTGAAALPHALALHLGELDRGIASPWRRCRIRGGCDSGQGEGQQ